MHAIYINDYKNPFNNLQNMVALHNNRKNEEKHALRNYDTRKKRKERNLVKNSENPFKTSFFKVKEFLLSFCARSSLSFSLFYMQTNKQQANLNITQQNKNKIDKTNKQERRKGRKEKGRKGGKIHHS